MSDRFGLMGLATVESQYLEGRAVLNCSDVTAAAVDEEVRKILETSYQEAKRILSENMDAMDVIADFLIKQETITGKEFMKMFNDVRARRDGGQKDLTDQQSEGAAEEATEAQETPDAQQITAQAAQEEPAETPAAETQNDSEVMEAAPEEPAAEAQEASAALQIPAGAAPEVQAAPAAQQMSVEAAQEEPAAEPAALQMPAEAVQRMSAAQQIPAEAEQAEPAKAAPETPAVPQEESAEEERRREDDDSRMSPEEVVRKNSAEKGRYSQVSLDDLFGE